MSQLLENDADAAKNVALMNHKSRVQVNMLHNGQTAPEASNIGGFYGPISASGRWRKNAGQFVLSLQRARINE